ncbi:hypothetical protein [Nannocystis sp. SCPEA4]|uniref:hypothetical protein n=1 Tax=Nannocystis sp. SCPEA4 TaxID=2996787 RepID=UPI00226E9D0E|nr:hypothetical protein [Nannocystis sp. SCPEA4]MCY1060569.1 hypothetical protein [Nannocystis sp. SCPEA4]
MSRKARLGLLGAMTALAISVAFASLAMAQPEPYCPHDMYLVLQETEASFKIVSSHAELSTPDGLVCLQILPLKSAQGPFLCNVNSVPNRPIPDGESVHIWSPEEIIDANPGKFAATCFDP